MWKKPKLKVSIRSLSLEGEEKTVGVRVMEDTRRTWTTKSTKQSLLGLIETEVARMDKQESPPGLLYIRYGC